jgi:hypothetical protein
MAKLVAFDSTYYRRGVANPFTTPLGVGLVPKDPSQTAKAMIEAFAELTKRHPTLSSRPFWSSVHLFRKLPGAPALDLLTPVMQRVLATIEVVSVSYTTTRLDRVRTHGLTEPRESDREPFMSNLQQDYVYHSLWKFGQTHDMNQYHAILDGMNPIITGGSARIATYDYEVVFHGDEVDPLVCAADLMAKYFDVKLASMPDPSHRYPSAPLNDDSLVQILRGSGVKLFTSVIGTRDFHYVTQLRSGAGPRPLPVRHPVVYLIREPPPREAGSFPRAGLETFEELSPVVDYVVTQAIGLSGCWKRWDNADLMRFDDQRDRVVYYGPVGEKLADWMRSVRPACRTERFDPSDSTTTSKRG